ncbi:MAG: hypothetical protein HGA85_06105 [Nanoarchaeota archaeon]|nr:hypothetical protein [Nanoarchaeota archaeon]
MPDPSYDLVVTAFTDVHQRLESVDAIIKAQNAESQLNPGIKYVNTFLGDLSEEPYEDPNFVYNLLFNPELFFSTIDQNYSRDAEAFADVLGQSLVQTLGIFGNHDGNFVGDAFYKKDFLAYRTEEIEGLNFGGIPGAPVYTQQQNFARIGGRAAEADLSRAKTYLSRRPDLDILLCHDVPDQVGWRLGDWNGSLQHNELLGKYFFEKNPMLMLSGHFHNRKVGVVKNGEKYSVYVNPGTAGDNSHIDQNTGEIVGKRDYGTFSKIYIDSKQKKVIKVEEWMVGFDGSAPRIIGTYDFSKLSEFDLEDRVFYGDDMLQKMAKPDAIVFRPGEAINDILPEKQFEGQYPSQNQVKENILEQIRKLEEAGQITGQNYEDLRKDIDFTAQRLEQMFGQPIDLSEVYGVLDKYKPTTGLILPGQAAPGRIETASTLPQGLTTRGQTKGGIFLPGSAGFDPKKDN